MTHVKSFLDGMDAGCVEASGAHLSDEGVLLSPFLPEPFTGRETGLGLLRVLREVIGSFTTEAVVADDFRAVVILCSRASAAEVTGVDDVREAEGRFITTWIQWRPLSSIVAIQNQIAPPISVASLRLVDRSN